MKSTVDEIRQRFDADVERFSNLETGQSATVDAPLAMALVAQAAAATTPHALHVVDVGCGAGNYTLKLLEQMPNLDVTLIDLSQPMLDRATQRIRLATTGRLRQSKGTSGRWHYPRKNMTSFLLLPSCTTCVPIRSGRMCSLHSTERYGPVVRSGFLIWSKVPFRRSKG